MKTSGCGKNCTIANKKNGLESLLKFKVLRARKTLEVLGACLVGDLGLMLVTALSPSTIVI